MADEVWDYSNRLELTVERDRLVVRIVHRNRFGEEGGLTEASIPLASLAEA
jgi:hypothetical protein